MSEFDDLSAVEPGTQDCFEHYQNLVMNAMDKMRAIHDFHQVAVGSATEYRNQQASRFVEALSPHFGKRVKLAGANLPEHLKPELVLDEEVSREYAAIRAEERVPHTFGIHNAASIVFAHSVFEALIHDLFIMDFRCNAESWDVDFGRSNVEYQEATRLTPEDLRKVVWEKKAKNITRVTGLVSNVTNLLMRCGVRRRDHYAKLCKRLRLDVASIELIDKLRQDLIHNPPIPSPIGEAGRHVDVLVESTAMVAHCCGVCLFDLPVAGIGFQSIEIST